MSRVSVNESVRKRGRQRARLMQAGLDGRGGLVEAPRMAKPPFIEPALLRAGFDMSGDPLVWFAIWNEGRNLASRSMSLLTRSSRASTP
jgi:hypothetical protein